MVGVHPVEGVAHRRGELFARDHAVAVRVEAAGAFAAVADDADFRAGLDPGRGLVLGRGAVEGGQQSDGDDGHEGGSSGLLMPCLDHGRLAPVFQTPEICFSGEMTRPGSEGMKAAMSDPSPRILVVDDDPGIREVLCDYLGQHGYRRAAPPRPPRWTAPWPRGRAGPDRAGPDDAGRGRAVGRAPPVGQRAADRHAVGHGRGHRPDRRAGAGRRRLSGQALQSARAAGPGPRGAAPPARGRDAERARP